MQKLIRITTVPFSLEKLLEGQLSYMNQFYEVTAVSAEKERLEIFGKENAVETFHIEMTREITPGKDLKALWKLYSLLKSQKPRIVHTHTPKAGILGMLAAKMAGVPIRLHTVGGMPVMETKGAKRRILEIVEKTTYACATRIYPNSKGLYDIILKEKFTSPTKMKLLGKGSSNGIDTDYFDPERFTESEKTRIRNGLEIPEEDLVFVFVGRLVTDKGINEMIQAFVELQEQYPEISLLLVGPFEQELDPIQNKTLNHIKEHSKIVYDGFQVDVRPYFAVADVLVFPSYREGFPNVVMQAGAMGIPSIVSDINGCNEIVEHEQNGIIIPVKDEQALKESMRKMILEPEFRNIVKQNSRKKIVDNYERKQFWELLLEEYRSFETGGKVIQ